MEDITGLKWDDLKVFLMVARYGDLMGASTALKVNHSTVFRRINTLEEALGSKLFDRTVEGYQLSALGGQVYKSVENIADTIGEVRNISDGYSNQLAGCINVTAPHNFAYRYFPKIIRDFQDDYPDIHINLIVTNKDCDLSKREADLAIRASSSPPDYLIGKKLFSFRWSLYGAAYYIDQYGSPECERDMASHRIISAYRDLEFLPAFKWINKNIPEQMIVARCNDLMAMSALAEEGVGLAVLPDDQNRKELCKLFPVGFSGSSDIWMLNHPNMRDCSRLNVFKTFLIDAFGKDLDIINNIV